MQGSDSCDISVPSGHAYGVSATQAPTGWYLNPELATGSGGSIVTSHPYQFRTTSLGTTSAPTVPGGAGTTLNTDTNPGASANNPQDNYASQTFSNRLAISRQNPPEARECGQRIALVLDQSSSMVAARQRALKDGANAAIAALDGTPSVLSIYTFGTVANNFGRVIDQQTDVPGDVTNLHNFVNNTLPNAVSGSHYTNWDQGLAQTLGGDYDLVVFLTDGAPTTSRLRGTPTAVNTYFTDVEQATFTANELKDDGVRVVGVGLALGDSGGLPNLRAVTGPTKNQDYFNTDNLDELAALLKDATAGSCLNTLTIRKRIRDANGDLVTPEPADANGWTFDNTITAGTVDTPTTTEQGQTGDNGFGEAAMADIPFNTQQTVTVTENVREGYTPLPGETQCTVDGENVDTTVTGNTASFTFTATGNHLECTFVNRRSPVTPDIETTQTPAPPGSVPVGGQTTDSVTVSAPADFLPTPTGTVTFELFDNATCTGDPLATRMATLDANGEAATPTPVTVEPPPGTRYWRVTFDPGSDANFTSVTSGCTAEPVDVTQAEPDISTDPVQAGSVPVGTEISDTATVTGGFPPVTGTVTFMLFGPGNSDCSTDPGPVHEETVPLGADGTATSPLVPTTQVGVYRWVAIYNGDDNNAIAESGCQDEQVTVTQATPTITTEASEGGPLGTPVFDTATFHGAFHPAGTVTFTLYGPGDPGCTGAPAFGPADVTIDGSTLVVRSPEPDFVPTAAGTYNWVVHYSGDDNNASFTTDCGADDESVEIGTVQPDAVLTDPSPGGPAGSTDLTDTATVTGGAGPTGTITWELFGPNDDECAGAPIETFGPITLGPGPNPSATSAPPFTPTLAGTYQWVAHYSGDGNNDPVSSQCGDEPVVIDPADPEITTTPVPPGPVTVGDSISDEATVTGGSNPTGTVTFRLFAPGDTECQGPPLLEVPVELDPTTGTTALPPTDAFTTSETGVHRWVATYEGDANNNAATSGCTEEEVTVNKAQPTIDTTPTQTSVAVGTRISDSATVTPGFAPLTGTVTFELFPPDDATCSGTPVESSTNDLVGDTGMATSDLLPTTEVGTYRWIATYNGDDNNEDVSSGCQEEPVTITRATPDIETLPIVEDPLGDPIGFAMSDTAVLTGGFDPTGTVTFTLYAPGDTSCAGPVVFTSADRPLAGNPPTAVSDHFPSDALGTYRWIATYNGDSHNESVASDCEAEPVIIGRATPNVHTEVSTVRGTVGLVVSDTAAVSGGFHPTGTVTFRLYGPGDTLCSRTPVFTSPNRPLVDGIARSGSFRTTDRGIHRWVAVYNGDQNNVTNDSGCQSELVTVGARPLPSRNKPAVRTVTSDRSVRTGEGFRDRIHVRGLDGRTTAAAQLYGPFATRAAATCHPRFRVRTKTLHVHNGWNRTPVVRIHVPGVYTWRVTLHANAANRSATHRCRQVAETTVVAKPAYSTPIVNGGFSGTITPSTPARRALVVIRMPAIGMVAPVRPERIVDGRMILPGDVGEVGWLRRSGAIGDKIGTSVIGGHVSDRHDNPGAMYHLSRAHAGQRITVTRAGERYRFKVVAKATFTRGHRLPHRYFVTRGRHRLVLISCTDKVVYPNGHFHYTRYVVVVATPIRR